MGDVGPPGLYREKGMNNEGYCNGTVYTHNGDMMNDQQAQSWYANEQSEYQIVGIVVVEAIHCAHTKS